jgi:hypothetical protein
MRRAGVHQVHLLVPGHDIQSPTSWVNAFPVAAPRHFDGNDADETALAFGQTLADILGRELVPREG